MGAKVLEVPCQQMGGVRMDRREEYWFVLIRKMYGTISLRDGRNGFNPTGQGPQVVQGSRSFEKKVSFGFQPSPIACDENPARFLASLDKDIMGASGIVCGGEKDVRVEENPHFL